MFEHIVISKFFAMSHQKMFNVILFQILIHVPPPRFTSFQCVAITSNQSILSQNNNNKFSLEQSYQTEDIRFIAATIRKVLQDRHIRLQSTINLET